MSSGEDIRPHLERLLRLLGVERGTPDLAALNSTVSAFVQRVPFENVSKLYYKQRDGLRRLPSLGTYVDGIMRYHFGGTCYANNYCLHLLLSHLGFDAMLCGADMNNLDVHLVNIVSLDDREYLVDAGYAAPFLAPLPRDLETNFEVALGRDRYVLKPQDEEGRSRMELHRDGEHKHGYVVRPVPRTIDHFERVIADSYGDGATFMNALLLVRFFPNRSVVLHNLTLIESDGADCSTTPIEGRDELPAVIDERFAIPQGIVAQALAGLGDFGDAWN